MNAKVVAQLRIEANRLAAALFQVYSAIERAMNAGQAELNDPVLALPGDDVTPDKFTGFWCNGKSGLYTHPNIWHGAIVPIDDHAELLDRQGRVHARVSVDFAKEFGCYLAVPMRL